MIAAQEECDPCALCAGSRESFAHTAERGFALWAKTSEWTGPKHPELDDLVAA